jgi:hypothetical protein
MADGKEDAARSDKPGRGNVELGCGTLIMIALIVMIFSGKDDVKQRRTQLHDMNQKIDRLEKKIDALAEKPSPQPSPQPQPSERP